MANKTIDQLTAAAAALATQEFEVYDPAGSPKSQKVTGTQLIALINAGVVLTTRQINTTAPVAGGGDLSANRTISVPAFVASGGSHAAGLVPDPGASAGTAKFLREDASWQIPSQHTNYGEEWYSSTSGYIVTLSSQNTWYTLMTSAWSIGLANNFTLDGSYRLVCGVAGIYRVVAHGCVGLGSSSSNYEIALAVNNTPVAKTKLQVNTVAPTPVTMAIACGGILNLSVNDYVDVQMENIAAASKTVTVYSMLLSIV